MKKRLLAIILACAMAVTCMPVMAFADDVQQGQPSVEENETSQYDKIMGIIRNLAQAYANNPEVVEKLKQLNDQLDGWKQSYALMYVLMENYQDRLNTVVGLMQEGKIEEIPGVLSEIPFEEIDAKINALSKDIEKAVQIARAIAAQIKDSEKVQQIGALIEAIEELKEFLKDYITAEDFGIAKLVSDYQALIQAHRDEIADAALALLNKADELETFIQEKYPEAYDAIQGYLETIRDNIKAASEADPQAAQNIKEALGTILQYIGGAPEAAQKITDAIEAKLAEIATQAKAYKEQAQQKLADIQNAIVVIANSVKDIDFAELTLKIKQSVQGIIQKAQEDVLEGILANMIDEIKTAIAQVKESGVVTDTIQNFMEKVNALREVVKAIEEIKPAGQIKGLDDLVEIAKELIKKYGKEILMNLVQRFMNGDFDAILAKMGLTKEEAIAKLIKLLPYIADIQAYIQGLMDGKGYLAVEFEAESLQFLNDILKEENESLETQITYLEATDTDLQSYYAANSANQKNAIKVAKGKPALQAAKSSKKGKKVTVKFKGIKKAKVSYYQVKIGKKTYTVKKATSSDKAVKAVIKAKGLKVGTTVKVKVRGVFTYQYRPDPADATVTKTAKYTSQWSKVIKMKVK